MATATKSAIMPMLAPTFVDGKTGVQFDAVASHVPSPKRSPGKRRVNALTDKSKTDIFSLSDAVLAERYKFISEIGFGNWGSVWRCQSKQGPSQGGTVSIKLVHRSKNPTSSARVRSLWQEFKCIRGLRDVSHPNIIAFHNFIITPSYALITMAHHPRCVPVALPEEKAAGYFRQLISAVDYLHAHGYSHNDIKPANILLSEEDSPILIDFGFAQHYTLSATDRFLSSLSWGTPEYLDPLRARGSLHDERLSDIWALGVTMYEIVVGRTPFEKTDAEEFLTRDALEIYYHRTTTGEFCGEFSISKEFGSLIHWMVEPNVNLRLSVCGKALRHRFFEPLASSTSSTSSKPPLSDAFHARTAASTPKRAPSTVGTPTSSAKKVDTPQRRVVKVGDRRDSMIKIYHDPETPSPSHIVASSTRNIAFSPRPLVLGERNGTAPSTPNARAVKVGAFSAKSPPPASRIPIRKADISSPVQLTKGVGSQHHRSQSSGTPARAVSTSKSKPSPPVVTPKSSLRNKTSLKRIAVEKKESPPPVPVLQKVEVASESRTTVKSQDEREVLASSKGSSAAQSRTSSVMDLGPRSSPSTPLSATFAPSPTRTAFDRPVSVSLEGGEGVSESTFPFSERWDVAGTYGRTSPLTVSSKPSSGSLTSKLCKLSLRRAPSSFFSLKGSLAQVGRRRVSTATSAFTLVDMPGTDTDRADAVTMPIETAEAKPSDHFEDEKARLESFSKHIQHIIDARKASQPPLPRRSVQPRQVEDDDTQTSILSRTEVQEFTAQVAQELAEANRQKRLSKEAFSPRAFRAASISRRPDASTSHSERPSPRIRPSLAPSFVGQRSPPKMKSTPPCVMNNSVSSFASATSSTDTGFKRGHRRIPTHIRNVPPIYLTESGDDVDSESEYSRADTPCSERPLSPPPASRIVEKGRQLPTWVPESDESEDDGDVDEPTVTITIPPRVRKPSKHSPRKSSPRKSLPAKRSPRTNPQPSTDSLYQQFVQATPRVARQSRIVPTSSQPVPDSNSSSYMQPVNFEPLNDNPSRSHSRASTWASSLKGHNRSRSVLSFLFSGSSSRASTPSMSVESLSGISGAETEEEGEQKKKGGKFRRAMKKILK